MKKIEITLNISTLFAAVCFLAGCLLVVAGWKEIKQAEIKQQSLEACLVAAKLTWQDGEQQGETVDQTTFDQCMSATAK